jgi:osmotically-inducible protein OsmY
MQSALAERPSTVVRSDRTDLSTVARQYLETHPHFRGRINGVSIAHQGRDLFLTGRLPTFYLKQLVQEAVRHVPGVQYVYNQIDVVNPNGVSSVRC